MSLYIVILAAGKGKRMFSSLPKVLNTLAGKEILMHVVETAQTLNPTQIKVVLGHQVELVQKVLAEMPITTVLQEEQLGTGHALHTAMPNIPDDATVLVLSGDVPLISARTLQQLLDSMQVTTDTTALALLTAHVDNPFGFGRIVRDAPGRIQQIVEERDATDKERAIGEIYTGICAAKAADLRRWLPALSCNNNQQEYYLTDIISLAVAERVPVTSYTTTDLLEIQGVNDRLQLHDMERALQLQIARQFVAKGVGIADAARFDVRGSLTCGENVFIDINVLCTGSVTIGDGTEIGPNVVLTNATLGKNVKILPNSVVEGCEIGDNCTIGPFARIRPGTRLAEGCRIGNFVETKAAVFGSHSKASHLSYIGDATIGAEVNIGTGTITCNYDGAAKHATVIEDGAFIGSGTELVAPVKVGKGATIGAGSTIRKDAPDNALTLTSSTQKTLPEWKRKAKKDCLASD